MQRYRHYTNGLGKKKKKKFLRPRQSRKVAGQNIIIIKFDSFMSTRYTRDPRVTQECPVWELITPHPRHKRDLCTQCKSRPNACKVYSPYNWWNRTTSENNDYSINDCNCITGNWSINADRFAVQEPWIPVKRIYTWDLVYIKYKCCFSSHFLYVWSNLFLKVAQNSINVTFNYYDTIN